MPAVGNSSNFRSQPAKAPPPPPRPVANLRTGNNPRGVAILPSRQAAPTRSFAGRVGAAITRTAPAPAAAARHVSTPARQAPRLAATLGGRAKPPPVTPSRITLGRALLRLYGGADRAFMVPADGIQSNAAMLGQQTRLDRMQTQGQFNQDFTNLLKAGLLPKGAKEPPLVFGSKGLSGGRSYESAGKVYPSPLETYLTGSGGRTGYGALGTWAKQVLVHEMAHTLQSPRTLSSVPDREGGAQAYTDAVTPRVLGPLPTNLDSNYTGYVDRARAKKGPQWYMQGQFATRRKR